MNITKYRSNLTNLDRAQLLTEFNHVLDQLQEVADGKRAAVDWPEDGVARPEHRKWTVADLPKPEYRGEAKRRQDGSAYYPFIGETK